MARRPQGCNLHPALTQGDLRRRIDEAAEYLPLKQMCLSPQCGFSSTVHGHAPVEMPTAK